MEGKLEDLKKLQRSNGFEIECYNLQDADYLANQIAGSQRLSSTKFVLSSKDKRRYDSNNVIHCKSSNDYTKK